MLIEQIPILIGRYYCVWCIQWAIPGEQMQCVACIPMTVEEGEARHDHPLWKQSSENFETVEKSPSPRSDILLPHYDRHGARHSPEPYVCDRHAKPTQPPYPSLKYLDLWRGRLCDRRGEPLETGDMTWWLWVTYYTWPLCGIISNGRRHSILPSSGWALVCL